MRQSLAEWGVELAQAAAKRSACLRRQVGCVLLDAKGCILAVGYNGVPRGEGHCDVCLQDRGEPCPAIHAELNALIQCKDQWAVVTCCVTRSPCAPCTRALLNTGCRSIYFIDESSHPEAMRIWVSRNRRWMQLRKA